MLEESFALNPDSWQVWCYGRYWKRARMSTEAHLGNPWAGGVNNLNALVAEHLHLLPAGAKCWQDDHILPLDAREVLSLAHILDDVNVHLLQPLSHTQPLTSAGATLMRTLQYVATQESRSIVLTPSIYCERRRWHVKVMGRADIVIAKAKVDYVS